MIKCRYADKYKAIFPPRCNKGDPCRTCQAKWANAAAEGNHSLRYAPYNWRFYW